MAMRFEYGNNMRNQTGFTLVEVMVSLALTSILMLGVYKIYAHNRASQEIQQIIGEMQENQRTVLAVFADDIRGSGFTGTALDIFDTTNTTEGSAISTNPAYASDAIAIRKESATDCMDGPTSLNPITNKPTATNIYYVDDINHSLMCNGSGSGPQPIAEGVENMQILYGVDTDTITPGAIRSANIYVPANQVTDFTNVVSVRISLLFMSDEAINTEATADTFDLLGVSYTPTNDIRNRRQLITTTIALRNAG